MKKIKQKINFNSKMKIHKKFKFNQINGGFKINNLSLAIVNELIKKFYVQQYIITERVQYVVN